jgi:hypothetical protein
MNKKRSTHSIYERELLKEAAWKLNGCRNDQYLKIDFWNI